MSSFFAGKLLAKSFLANLIAQFIPPLISVLLVPFYLLYLGVEAFGLIGFLFAFSAALNFFTKGINWAFQREVAQRSVAGAQLVNIPNLLRTFELTYWVFGFILGACIAIFSDFIAINFLQSNALSSSDISSCILLISVRIAISFPVSVYGGLMIGFDRQILNNLILTSVWLVGSAITVAAVVIYKSVIVFFWAELFGAFIGLLLQRYWAYKIINQNYKYKSRFDIAELVRLWRESIHLIGINGIGVIIKTIDRIILGLLLPLSGVAIYNIGRIAGELVSMIYGAYLNSIFPSTCRSVSNNEMGIVSGIIFNTKIIWSLTLAVSLPLVIASEDIVGVWTQQPGLVVEAAKILSIFVFGNLFLSISNVIHQTLVALRRTQQSLMFNMVSIFIMAPAIYLLVSVFGSIGAAWVWVSYGLAGWVFSFYFIAPFFNSEQVFEYFRFIILSALVSALLAFGQYFISTNFLEEYLWTRIVLALISFFLTFILTMFTAFGASGLRNLFGLITGKN
jgi:O-antigen/teichoic acid export membrane protein